MDPVTAGTAAISSLKSLYEIAKSVRDSNDPEKLRMAAAQMLEIAITAKAQFALLQDQFMATVAQLSEIRAEIKKLEDFDAKAKNFVRAELGGGGFVYREKFPTEGERRPPSFCANCFGKRQLTIMQPIPEAERGMVRCPECKAITI